MLTKSSVRTPVALLLLTLSACVAPPPIRLSGAPPTPSAPSGARVEAPLRRLTRAQYHQSVLDLFAPLGWTESPAARFPGEERAGPFLTNLSALTPLDVDVTFAAAESLAALAAPDAEKLSGCQPLTASCALGSLQKLSRRAWRRPATADEVARFTAMLNGGDVRAGYALGLTAILASPSFLQLVELGTPDGTRVRLSGFEVAGRLGLLVRGSVPDDALLDAAASGALDSGEGVAEQTWRLLRDDRAAAALADFHAQWLGLTGSFDKSTARYPFWTPAVQDAMRQETATFVDTVIRRSDGKLGTLLSAPFTALPSPLERVYGLKPQPPGSLVGLDPAQRGGLFTQPAFLAAHAHPKWTSPVHRGLTITRDVLCLPLGDPPPTVDLTPIGVDPTGEKTRRQLVEQHSNDARCSGCHRVMDPLGLAFEHYDAVGAWREVDLDDRSTIDSAVTISLGDPDLDGPVQSATELLGKLARAKSVRRCVATQWYRYALGRMEAPADAAELAALQTRFEASDGTIPDLLVALTTSDAFRTRAP